MSTTTNTSGPQTIPSTSTSSSTSSTTSMSTSSTTLTTKTTVQSTTSSSTTSTSSPSTTSSPTTTKPMTTTTKCISTISATPTCEYGCGKWCSKPIPPFTDHPTCKISLAECILQIADCFLTAGWPASLQCAKYQSWCQSIGTYCGNICASGKCNKGDCISSNPPVGGQSSVTTTTTTGVCPASSSTSKSSTSSSISSTAPIPTVSSLCLLPNGPPGSGYSNGASLGNIPPPALICNNLSRDFAAYPFKLYTSKDSSSCQGYSKAAVPQACKDACLAQYTSCVGTYAEGCRAGGGYEGAKAKCGNQYADCLSVNKVVGVGSRCTVFGEGWS
ncbi:MAG: hypothetical protein Q9220_003241 [cf. Caloplaca sp. 1 TL-2023]